MDPVKKRVDAASRPTPCSANLPLPLSATLQNRFSEIISRLSADLYGKREPHIEEAELYRVYVDLKGKIDKEDLLSKVALMHLLQDAEPESGIQLLRRQVILAILSDFIDEKTIQKLIQSEHIKKAFLLTFALNMGEDRITIRLSDALCEMLKIIRGTEAHAYARLDAFLDKLSSDERVKIDRTTAQYIDHGKKRYVFRVQYEGRNAALIIGMGDGTYFRTIAKTESRLYAIAKEQTLTVLKLPEVFAVIGPFASSGIVMTDCTKGGNASLMCTDGNNQLIPSELRDGYAEDIRKLHVIMTVNGVTAFDYVAGKSTYVQRSKKTGEVAIYALDFENLV